MNLRDIAAEWLRDHGYTGLMSSETLYGCGCGLYDLMTCDEPGARCQPAYLRKCTDCPPGDKCDGALEQDGCYHLEKLGGDHA